MFPQDHQLNQMGAAPEAERDYIVVIILIIRFFSGKILFCSKGLEHQQIHRNIAHHEMIIKLEKSHREALQQARWHWWEFILLVL